jgi:hypothetical protein
VRTARGWGGAGGKKMSDSGHEAAETTAAGS